MDLHPPFFLAAMPALTDDYFSRAVVLVAEQNEDGAFGVVVNHPLVDEEENPTQMTAEVKDLAGNTLSHVTEDLFEGGPVNDEAIFALHEIESLGQEQSAVGQGLYLETDPEVFQKVLEKDENHPKRRFYLGCSQWTAGQLESEMRSGAWLAVPYDRRFIFDRDPEKLGDGEDLWKEVMRAGGVDPLTVMTQGNSDAGPN